MYRTVLRTVHVELLHKRFFKKCVRVRFAPSPTGYLHLGGLRTALYNYLFARANGGSFILRIEDTDQSRVLPGAIEKLQEDLFWAGVITDEDPIRGGPTGPYVQSKRLEIYHEQVAKLLKYGSAYRCFCSERRLELVRREAVRTKQIPKYDNRCRHLTETEINEKLTRGENHCIRFKLSSDVEPFEDMVYGKITYDVTRNEGDPVIIKADGFPTYHFANVVDDHLMEISHVLRGVEWQISTPKHLMMYKAFGWLPPQFGHLPLLLNSDGSKLSKRQGDVRVDAYREQGIFPLALVNYITHAGGGFNRKNDGQHCYSYSELIKQFDVNLINVNSTKLWPEKLLEFNKLELLQLLENEKNYEFFLNKVNQLVLQAFPERASDGSLQLHPDHVIAVLKWASTRISKLSDLVAPDLAFVWVLPTCEPNIEKSELIEAVKVLSEMLENIDPNNFDKQSLGICLRSFAEEKDIPFPEFMKLLRTILSGLKDGPGVAEMMEILGRETTLTRLKRSFG
ncbi:probable glutamate--tRNA ligase, mitochondrial [Orussus abietinus]|uniref:probable glutamate--tRNA ligase, mitochondrial n=1 Tax=Orussus abietinus TaxID=222816 RepID=UPI0006253791|nr:probable glutamate--tRNA ligase, mitochondrial [Orussus abietinus]